MRRSQFLANGTALLSVFIAGCGHPPVVLDMDDATANDIADEVSMAPEPDSEEYTLVTSARGNGSATRIGAYELFDTTNIVRMGDVFYEVSETRLESDETTVYDVRIDFDPDDSTPELGAIEYDDLPAADRNRLDSIPSEENTSDRGRRDIGIHYGTAEEVGNESVFVPRQRYDIIIRGENRYRVAVATRTVTEAEYRYEVTEVAPDVDTFADRIRERHSFELTDLSDAERAVVEEATDGGYFEDDDAFRSVIDRIRGHEGIDVTDIFGTWLVEYERAEYITYAEW
ncbi:hypothetical protein BG842_05900 [Haladaptatus sp. W1]|uniref:hypothetical protein n=1 Tax=Haladaptatus sp. W1 TaxID=1897478 RepID=UPI000849D832|nr:hypothetical protein [Haladaptatus sp. W1]ODR79519.1 hypothetical protein BG842_05900 [Haladaptatus sp. W1]